MAGIRAVKRCALVLLLCFSLFTTAFAFAPQVRSDISIRITPPGGEAVQRAEVEVQFTDNTGSGLQAAHVKAGDASWREVTGQLDRTDNCYRYVLEITENCTVTARAIGQDGTVFEKSEKIDCFAASSGGTANQSGGSASQSGGESAQPDREAVPLTPDGQASVLDDATDEDGKEFFTVKTPNENVFYLVIDRQKNSENVYLLNSVTESDLKDLAEKDKDDGSVLGTSTPAVSAVPEPEPEAKPEPEPEPEPVCNCTDQCVPGEVKTDCPVCVLSLKDCTGKAPDDSAKQEGEKSAGKKSGSGMLLVILAALAAGGVGYYLKIYKPKRELDDAEDIDDVIGGEETVNEDEERDGAIPIQMGADDWDWNRSEEPGEPARPVEPVQQTPVQQAWETWVNDEPDEPDEPARQDEPESPNALERGGVVSEPMKYNPEDYGLPEPEEPEKPHEPGEPEEVDY